ncbi:hypothetical protein QO222_02880 [Vibrio vulnificus]|nr:hypothetical protein [Vibrio vulnificus]MDK2618982.1 hypothetical protein [Vibrio vulnificus]
MVFTSKVKVVISAIAIVLSSTLISIDMFGVIPFLVLVVSLFTLIIQGGLCLLGYKNGDALTHTKILNGQKQRHLQTYSKIKKSVKSVSHRFTVAL